MLSEILDELISLRHDLLPSARPAIRQQFVEDGQPHALVLMLIMQTLQGVNKQTQPAGNKAGKEAFFSFGVGPEASGKRIGEP